MEYQYYIAECLLRIFTGMIFLFQGYDKLFRVKIRGVVDAFYYEAQKENIPKIFVKLMASYTSIVEFFGGLLLVLGLFKTVTLTLLGVDIILAGLAFSIVEPVWNMKHVFPRLLLIGILLVQPNEWEFVSLDNLLNNVIK